MHKREKKSLFAWQLSNCSPYIILFLFLLLGGALSKSSQGDFKSDSNLNNAPPWKDLHFYKRHKNGETLRRCRRVAKFLLRPFFVLNVIILML